MFSGQVEFLYVHEDSMTIPADIVVDLEGLLLEHIPPTFGTEIPEI